MEKYQDLYNVSGTVLYPSRESDVPQFSAPPERLGRNAETFTCAFAGTINSGEIFDALKLLAENLQSIGGRLLIFGPLSRAKAEARGLIAPNVMVRGLLSSAELMHELRDVADSLFVPMAFSAEHRANMEISFPSKLTDYTALGLPLLIYGPKYCSAVRWAMQNPRVAEVVDSESSAALMQGLLNIKNNVAYRMQLGENALVIGKAYFSNEVAFGVFKGCLAHGRRDLDARRA